MTRKDKNKIVEALVKRLSAIDHFYVIDAEGLSAEEISDFRRRCFQAGVVYQVVKNTLVSRALGELKNEVDYSVLSDQVLKGFSGILFPQDVGGGTPAKIIKEFRKQRKLARPLFKGACIDKELFVGEAYLDVLSQLKSKTQLFGELITLLKSPITRLMASMQSGEHQLVGTLKALAERKA